MEEADGIVLGGEHCNGFAVWQRLSDAGGVDTVSADIATQSIGEDSGDGFATGDAVHGPRQGADLEVIEVMGFAMSSLELLDIVRVVKIWGREFDRTLLTEAKIEEDVVDKAYEQRKEHCFKRVVTKHLNDRVDIRKHLPQ